MFALLVPIMRPKPPILEYFIHGQACIPPAIILGMWFVRIYSFLSSVMTHVVPLVWSIILLFMGHVRLYKEDFRSSVREE
ncbi:hypothetical protein HOY80DRAFT_940240, partial [Tuber brumale]